MFADKISRFVYQFIARLLFCRLATGCQEQHTPTEDSYSANLGPLRLSLNECFVLDHADASIALRLPFWQHVITLAFRVCIGTEQIRPQGLTFVRNPST